MTGATGAPQTKTSELLTRLHIMARDGLVDEMELKRIGRDAENLLNADAFMGHQVLGAWAALQHDGEAARSHHRIALNLAQNAPDKRRLALYNLAVSLKVLGEYPDAATQVNAAMNIGTSTDDELTHAAEISVCAGHFSDAAELMGKMGQTHAQAPAVTALLAAVRRGVFSEAGLQASLAAAHEIIQSERIQVLAATIHAEEVEEDEFFMEIRLRASYDTAKSIESRHDLKTADDPNLSTDPGSAFVPVFQGEIPCVG